MHYITGYPIILHTNHAAIKYLMKKPITNGRVTIWLLLLQYFDITILDKPRLFITIISNENEPPVEDCFLDEHLSAISTNLPWFADIANFLASRKLPDHLTPKE